MEKIILLEDVEENDLPRIGGKAYSLALMAGHGFNIADALCITTEAYNTYVSTGGLRERILLELNRKDAREMRWEEVWDSALRIRNMFLNTSIPAELYQSMYDRISEHFGKKTVVVRSSSPAEDSATASFAGLHESFVNITGIENILKHIKLVWASLWSDASILYRQELGLNIETSSMAVVIQEVISGKCSGVVFSQNPTDSSQVVIEAVYGLNQGFVDGIVEPDRWLLDRSSGLICSFTPAQRHKYMVPDSKGIKLVDIPAEHVSLPPLAEGDVLEVFDLALKAEEFFGRPQDVEWTIRENRLYTLQSRPITTVSKPDPQDDRRQWDLSLRRSYENLKLLRHRIEKKYIPEMIAEADRLAIQDITTLSDKDLASEIERRSKICKQWKEIYWAEFIPFAHGIRLFGQVYNDAVPPNDPYQFVQLLQATKMQSLERNRQLYKMASMLRDDKELFEKLESRHIELLDSSFTEIFQDFIHKFGYLTPPSLHNTQAFQEQDILINVLLEMASSPSLASQKNISDTEKLKEEYLSFFEDDERRQQAQDILELARSSYKLRDDDNIYLGRIEDHFNGATHEGRKRLAERNIVEPDLLTVKDIKKALLDPGYSLERREKEETSEIEGDFLLKSRQMVGQPAGSGLANGSARVILAASDLAEFKYGEILVCDAVDPTMTFIVPLAAGIIERRGGMLIHGAIIAREYGIPCVTGVPEATKRIRTGDQITVDGYLGIVTVLSA